MGAALAAASAGIVLLERYVPRGSPARGPDPWVEARSHLPVRVLSRRPVAKLDPTCPPPRPSTADAPRHDAGAGQGTPELEPVTPGSVGRRAWCEIVQAFARHGVRLETSADQQADMFRLSTAFAENPDLKSVALQVIRELNAGEARRLLFPVILPRRPDHLQAALEGWRSSSDEELRSYYCGTLECAFFGFANQRKREENREIAVQVAELFAPALGEGHPPYTLFNATARMLGWSHPSIDRGLRGGLSRLRRDPGSDELLEVLMDWWHPILAEVDSVGLVVDATVPLNTRFLAARLAEWDIARGRAGAFDLDRMRPLLGAEPDRYLRRAIQRVLDAASSGSPAPQARYDEGETAFFGTLALELNPNDPVLLAQVKAWLASPNWGVRVRTADALGYVDHPQALPWLRNRLSEEENGHVKDIIRFHLEKRTGLPPADPEQDTK